MKTITAKNFKPTDEMVHAAKAVFICMAAVETVRPVVEGYQKNILAFWKFQPAKEWRKNESNEPILEPNRAYLLSENDFRLYMADIRDEQKKAGLKTDNPDNCPLLVAESGLRKAKAVLIDVMEPMTGFTVDKMLCAGMEVYDKYIELTLRLLAPYVK